MRGKSFEVTPWEVSGDVDYDRLVKKFGVSKIDNKLLERIKKHTGELHPMLRRKVFFAHRDLEFALEHYRNKKNLFLYTGCGPSGPIHLGHAFVWEFTKWLQDKLGLELWFQFTDDEKFLVKKSSYDEIQKWMYENMLDVIAIGFDPKKTHFLVDTKHASLIYPEAIKVAKKLTYSAVKATFGLKDSDNIGKIFFTSVQAVPAFLPSIIKKKKMACLIPHAIDQDPHFRLTRDILPKLGFYKPASIQCSFLPPLTGSSGKMSSSTGKSIYLTDSPAEVKNKINKYAFSGGQHSVEEHRKKGGNPDVDVSFQYLKMFFEPDDEKLKKIYDDYKSGKMLTSELKNILIEKINAFLKKHQSNREKAKSQIDKFLYKV
ncbi:tryptophan--tRNA ligase [Candidatus Pacearchaeota archaeon]|nr:tryptophan--tRNA ligase [Candidatus Pacearchaeota archaeon]